MPRIFISYRRADNRYVIDRIYERLTHAFGREEVFKDIDSIPLGADFVRKLEQELSDCRAVLVVIGDQWLHVKGKSGLPRLQEPNDFVRTEIEIALRRQIPVIPLLVDGASIPAEHDLPASIRPLSLRNGTSVRPEPDFQYDMERLIRALEKITAIGPPAAASSSQRPAERADSSSPTWWSRWGGWTILLALAALLTALIEIPIALDRSDEPLTTAGDWPRSLTTGSWRLDRRPQDVSAGWFSHTLTTHAVWTFYRDGTLTAGKVHEDGSGYVRELFGGTTDYRWMLDGESGLALTRRYNPAEDKLRFQVHIEEGNIRKLTLKPIQPTSKDAENPVFMLAGVPRVVRSSGRPDAYGVFVPTWLALALAYRVRGFLRRGRVRAFFLTLFIVVPVGTLLSMGYGWMHDELSTNKPMFDHLTMNGMVGGFFSLVSGLALAARFTWTARKKA